MGEGLSWTVQAQGPSEGCGRRVTGAGGVRDGNDGAGAAGNSQASLSPRSLRVASCDLAAGVSLGFLPAWLLSSDSQRGWRFQE